MGDEAPERLFYATMLRDVFRVFADASRGRGIIDGLDPDVFATSPEMIAVSFDASPYLDRKFFALDGAPFGVRRHAGDAEESAARRRADAAGVSSGVGARSVPPRRRARPGSTVAAAGLLRRVGNRSAAADRGRRRVGLTQPALAVALVRACPRRRYAEVAGLGGLVTSQRASAGASRHPRSAPSPT